MSYEVNAHEETDKWIRQLDTILSCISHDLKNPLSIIRGNAQLAMMINPNQKVEICLNRIIDAVDEINADLSEVSYLRTSKNITKTMTSLAALLQEITQMLKPLIEEYAIIEDYSMEPDVIAPLNQVHMRSALKHIIKNAVDAMSEGGVLRITLDSDNEYVYVTVSDTGKGIAPDVRAKLFKEIISTKQGGRGLGLILADQVIRASHGGGITYDSSNKGTTFMVQLPITQPAS
jgi:signal transduction histidine kinase